MRCWVGVEVPGFGRTNGFVFVFMLLVFVDIIVLLSMLLFVEFAVDMNETDGSVLIVLDVDKMDLEVCCC